MNKVGKEGTAEKKREKENTEVEEVRGENKGGKDRREQKRS